LLELTQSMLGRQACKWSLVLSANGDRYFERNHAVTILQFQEVAINSNPTFLRRT